MWVQIQAPLLSDTWPVSLSIKMTGNACLVGLLPNVKQASAVKVLRMGIIQHSVNNFLLPMGLGGAS